jgi:hypothetical protein
LGEGYKYFLKIDREEPLKKKKRRIGFCLEGVQEDLGKLHKQLGFVNGESYARNY